MVDQVSSFKLAGSLIHMWPSGFLAISGDVPYFLAVITFSLLLPFWWSSSGERINVHGVWIPSHSLCCILSKVEPSSCWWFVLLFLGHSFDDLVGLSPIVVYHSGFGPFFECDWNGFQAQEFLKQARVQGFSVHFSKECWFIGGIDVCFATQETELNVMFLC